MKSNLKTLALVGILSSATTLAAYKLAGWDKKEVILNENTPSAFTRFTSAAPSVPGNPGDFTFAAEKATPAVVHIKSKIVRESNGQQMDMSDMFEQFFGGGGGGMRQQRPQRQEGMASGSGVIISSDGYIVTNNHVVADSKELEVILNDRRSYKAKLIGRDPNTDIAVIKVQAENLPFLSFGNSDDVKVGEWVLAVGNPFDLESTVTAGIISAKGRGIGILSQDGGNPIESFLQTDAAVNPGNSGGALVDLQGNLVGINTAIAGSQTGTYVGYAFAVPVSIVKKVAGDLLKYGAVQRAFLGISGMQEVNNTVAEQLDLKANSGIYVGGFSKDATMSAAKAAGVKVGDVVTKIDGVETNTVSQLVERVGRKKPGESVVITINRAGQTKDVNVTLRNITGTTSIVKGDEIASTGGAGSSSVAVQSLGVRVGDLSAEEKTESRLTGGAKVLKVDQNGVIAQATDIKESFVVTKVNNQPVKSAADFARLVAGKRTGIRIEGVNLDEPTTRYSFSF